MTFLEQWRGWTGRGTRILPAGLLLLSGLALGSAAGAAGPRLELFELTAKRLEERGRVELPPEWLYHPGDDPAFAIHGYDDSAWFPVDARLQSGLPPEWDGRGWFRLRFWVDPALSGKPLSLTLEQYGAAEVYLDGELLAAFGEAGPSPAETRREFQRVPHLFSFDGRGVHVLAVRFANHDVAAFEALGHVGGFRVHLHEANERLASFASDVTTHTTHKAFFSGVFGAFALLHLLLFIFYPKARQNLYFALLAGVVTFLTFVYLDSFATTDPAFFLHYRSAMNVGWICLAVCAVRFVHHLFYDRPPAVFWVVLGLAAVLVVPGWLWPRAAGAFVLILVLMACAEMTRSVLSAVRQGRPGARTLGLGILALAFSLSVWLMTFIGLLPATLLTLFLMPFVGMFLLIFLMSVHLSRHFARTSRDLEDRLMEVEALSELQIQQERRARTEAVERARLAAELEEARRLQLSMLPEHLPELPDLEIAADMHTATEVGGDYYDFSLAENGALTIAIGDATGHGMRAGTMVTATKSLFGAVENGADLRGTLHRFTKALKRMNLRQLSMALTLARFEDGRLRLAAAGMPPAFHFRAASRDVASVEMPGAPLGSLVGFEYREASVDLAPGDIVLLMSDGFPERLNPANEMLGYDKAREAFSRAASQNGSARAVIDRLVADSEDWAAGAPAQDDMTFVVLRRSS